LVGQIVCFGQVVTSIAQTVGRGQTVSGPMHVV